MKIFGYEIKKIPKSWEFSDVTEFLTLITSHFNNLSNVEILPKMTVEQKVHIIKIFYKDFCEFEII